MNEFEFITLDDLNEVMRDIADNLIKEKNLDIQQPLQQIKMMCLLFQRMVSMPEQQEDAYRLGAQIVFRLRSFLLQSDIQFTIGAISPDGTKLSTTPYTQYEVLNNLRINLTAKQVELSSSLEKYNEKNIDTYSSLWPKILNVATNFEWPQYSEKKKYMQHKGKKKPYVYNQSYPDINVWVRYYTHSKQKLFTYYYDKGNFDLVGYNKGWLYEWFQEYIQDPNNAQEIESAFATNSSTPLQGMMSNVKRENIAGYKGGDYQLANGNYAQAKYNNKRLITFKSINTVITDILTYINNFESQKNYAKEQLAQDLITTFTHKDTINQSYENIVTGLLQQLKL